MRDVPGARLALTVAPPARRTITSKFLGEGARMDLVSSLQQ